MIALARRKAHFLKCVQTAAVAAAAMRQHLTTLYSYKPINANKGSGGSTEWKETKKKEKKLCDGIYFAINLFARKKIENKE